ncbi:hypothetical protein EJB05_45829, partial [Eragrostis curvula]
MAAGLPNLALVALCTAIGRSEILDPVFRFVEDVAARNPVVEVAVVACLITIAVSSLAGSILVRAAAPLAPAALWGFADLLFRLVFRLMFFGVVPLTTVLLVLRWFVLHLITIYLSLWGAILYNGFTYSEVNRMQNNATRMAIKSI